MPESGPVFTHLYSGGTDGIIERNDLSKKGVFMNFQSIENYITQFPIYQYTFLSIDDIEFNDKVRTICKRECPRYGKSWSCPPQ